jgi:hypothetical protein
VLERLLGITVKLMVAKSGIDSQMLASPYRALGSEDFIVVYDIPAVRNISIHKDRVWMFFGNLLNHQLPHPRIGHFDVGWVSKALITECDYRSVC